MINPKYDFDTDSPYNSNIKRFRFDFKGYVDIDVDVQGVSQDRIDQWMRDKMNMIEEILREELPNVDSDTYDVEIQDLECNEL